MDLKTFRESREPPLTQDELARALGLRSKGYISAIEAGHNRPGLELAIKIERLTGGLVTAASLRPEKAELLAGVGREAGA